MSVRLRLRTRLTRWFAGSILLILAPFIAGMLAVEWRSMRASLDHHLNEDLEVASEMLVPNGGGLQWRVAAERDIGYDAGPQRWVEVYGTHGRLLFVRGVAKVLAGTGALPASSNIPMGYQTVRTPAGAHVRVLTAIKQIGTLPVIMRVARSEDELRGNFRRLLLIISIGVPLAVLCAAVAGYFISGRALTPLARMAERARSISAEDLSQRLPVDNPEDELGNLAAIFNETFARLEGSFARLNRFTSDASHQLRTPLTAIRSVGEVGLQETLTADGYREVIGSMLEEADRLSRLVDTLLTLSRWDSGRVQAVAESMDLTSLTNDTAAQLSVLAEERGIHLETDVAGPLRTCADALMVRQALMNVIDNAIKFAPSGTTVRVHGTADATEVRVIVDDEGPGIPEADRQRVFERFYRVDRDRASAAAGSGLGLAIAHWAMTVNHGSIAVENRPRRGLRVVLSLPRES